MNSPLRLLATLIFFALHVHAQDVVQVGAGSYTTRLPDGAKAPPAMIYRTANVKGPMPTNDWWSSLAWLPLSDSMYPHPLAVRAVHGGLRVAYPGANITANKSAIFGFLAGDGPDDFVIGHSGVESFAEARVDGFNDWFVSALFEDHGKKLRTTFGHGSPYVFVEIAGGNPTLTFGKEAPKIWSGTAKDAVLGISVKGRSYGVFAPTGSTWSDLAATKWTAETKGMEYFSVAVLPDTSPETLKMFAKSAHHHVTDTRASGSFDEKTATVRTTFTFTTKSREGEGEGTLFALYPHQWSNTTAKLGDQGYDSVRGRMKLGSGSSFTTEMKYPGVLPALPLVAGEDKAKLGADLAELVNAKATLTGDTYWLGKVMGKWATALPIAEQTGNTATVETLTQRLKDALQNFFTATSHRRHAVLRRLRQIRPQNARRLQRRCAAADNYFFRRRERLVPREKLRREVKL